MKRYLYLVALSLVFTASCMPGAYVTKNPTRFNHGVRYYRPKPYLFVTALNTAVTDANGKLQHVPLDVVTDRYVQIQMQYLPDFAEEYSVRVRPGIGKAKVGMTLKNGWNLDSINQELDSQLNENINAVAGLLGGVKKLMPTGGGGATAATDVRTVISATNVPLGYYESVVGEGQDGVKRLYGWRYIGFMPFTQCPVNAGGAEAWCCNEAGPLYGLVFEKGTMVFRTLDDISLGPDLRRLPDPSAARSPTPELRARFEQDLKSELQRNRIQGIVVQEVRIDGLTLAVVLAGDENVRLGAEAVTYALAEGSQLSVRVEPPRGLASPRLQ